MLYRSRHVERAHQVNSRATVAQQSRNSCPTVEQLYRRAVARLSRYSSAIKLGDCRATVARLLRNCCATVARQSRNFIAELLPDCSATVGQQLGDKVARLSGNCCATVARLLLYTSAIKLPDCCSTKLPSVNPASIVGVEACKNRRFS